jgi:hypothetical protein
MSNITDRSVFVVLSSWGLHSVHDNQESAELWRGDGQRIESYAIVDNVPGGDAGAPSATPRRVRRRKPLTRDERLILLFAVFGLVVAASLVVLSVLRMSHAA